MYIDEVCITNYKAIKNIKLNFIPGVNLIVGDNGVGKTAMLEAVGVAIGGYLTGIGATSPKNIYKEDINIHKVVFDELHDNIVYNTPVEIACKAHVDGEAYEWSRIRKTELANAKTLTVNNAITRKARKMINDPQSCLPLICCYSTARIGKFRKGNFGKSVKQDKDRRAGYVGCVSDLLDLKGVREWCKSCEFIEFKNRRPMKSYETFKNVINGFMHEMEPLDNASSISYSLLFEDIVFGTEDNSLPISYLSAGYQSVLCMVMDLAFRNAQLNPLMENTEEMTGIVLVDEIDMHLHPKWQWRIIPALKKVFPNIQFIIATHSPIIISSAKDTRILRVSPDQEVCDMGNSYANHVNDVIDLIQQSCDIPMELRKLSEDYNNAVDDFDEERARILLLEMKEKYGDANGEVKVCSMLYDSIFSEA